MVATVMNGCVRVLRWALVTVAAAGSFPFAAVADGTPPGPSADGVFLACGAKRPDRALSSAEKARLAELTASLADKGTSRDDLGRRVKAARALGLEIGHAAAIAALERAVQDTKDDYSVRAEALAALSVIPHKSVIPMLIRALADSETRVRDRANEQLERLSGQHLWAPFRPDGAPAAPAVGVARWEQWWQASADAFTFDRWPEAALTLGVKSADRQLSATEAAWLSELNASLLDRGADHGKDPRRRAEAARGLGEIGHKDAIPALRQVMEDTTDDYAVRCEALTALSRIADKSVVPILIRALGDDQLQRRASWQLIWLSGTTLGLTFGPETSREEEIAILTDKWTQWWEENQDTFVFDLRRML